MKGNRSKPPDGPPNLMLGLKLNARQEESEALKPRTDIQSGWTA